MPHSLDTLLEEFEDFILSESKDNEVGLVVCEVDVLRKYAKRLVSSALEAAEEKIKKLYAEFEERNEYVIGQAEVLQSLSSLKPNH